jgi:hypothetical protein
VLLDFSRDAVLSDGVTHDGSHGIARVAAAWLASAWFRSFFRLISGLGAGTGKRIPALLGVFSISCHFRVFVITLSKEPSPRRVIVKIAQHDRLRASTAIFSTARPMALLGRCQRCCDFFNCTADGPADKLGASREPRAVSLDFSRDAVLSGRRHPWGKSRNSACCCGLFSVSMVSAFLSAISVA